MPLTLSEALVILESGQWCSLRYITANTSKGSGGKVIELQWCKIARRQTQAPGTGNKSATTTFRDDADKKDPNHRYHFTRNIELRNKSIRTVYPILMTHINGQSIL